MEAPHGRGQGDSHTTDSDTAVLGAFFRKGMLTVHAERLIDLVLQELEPGASGDWTADRVKDWIEQEKDRIGRQNQFEEVSALADALTWAVKHPNPDLSDPAEQLHWGVGFQSQEVPLSSVSISSSFTAVHKFQLQQNAGFHLTHTGGNQDGFGNQTDIPPSASQTHPALQGLGFSSVIGTDQLCPRGTNYLESIKLVAPSSSVYNRYDDGGFGSPSEPFGVVPENTEVHTLDRNRAPHQKFDTDSQVLIDSFAAYDRMSTNDNTPISASGASGNLSPGAENHAGNYAENNAAQNDQLAGLLEAVTTAVGQEAAQYQVTDGGDVPTTAGRPRRTTRKARVLAPPQVSQTNHGPPASNGKRKRRSSAKVVQKDEGQQRQTAIVVADTPPFINRRRKRPAIGESQDGTTDRDGEVDAEADGSSGSLEIRELPPRTAISDARAAGVYSAAALFRQPSSSGKKYTRPPMSKLFASLELTPENFLHLQAAAKGFMLDKNHPERQNCVGSRGQSDTDMVKLRLYNCVKDFLEMEGNGEKFFGKNVLPEGIKKEFVWPAQQHQIISLVTPLLRRMVTNERQRQYAIETRKGRSNKRKFSETESPMRNGSSGLSEIGSSVEMDEAPFQHFNVSPDEEPRPGIADLGLISGLSQADWNVLVATVQEHFHYDHTGHTGDNGCSSQCINRFFHNVFVKEMGYLEKSDWSKVGSNDVYADSKQEHAYEIVRDLFCAVIRNMEEENTRHNTRVEQPAQKNRKISSTSTPKSNCSSDRKCRRSSQRAIAPLSTTSSHEAGTQTFTPPESSDRLFDIATTSSSPNVKLQIHILQNSLRIYTPFYIESNNCPDYESFCRAALKDALPGCGFKVQMLLGTGLVGVGGDKEFDEALKGVRETVWMDGEARVVLELDEE
ncbi:MAG: hypothetical protein M1840_001635 [Geoglossum simile]|nr:MAG: hypothetical protein M1840_001635 [Geoglossum simile]